MSASDSQRPRDDAFNFEMKDIPEGVLPPSDPSDKMWLLYLSESEKHDNAISDHWKDSADGVLVFTGLFSATVATFIIASYPLLSSNSGDQTVFLLQQISQQLSGLSNGTYVRPQEYPPFSPSASIVCTNAMWILSLIVSIACALLAMLTQQWARLYVELPQLRTTPRERAYLRSFLFFGLKRSGISAAVELIPTLLHLSVFLFFVGLVIFLFTIFRTVAIIISVAVGIFSVVYIALTILPCVHLDHLYRTPLSSSSWYMWHTVVRYLMALFLWIEAIFHVRGVLIDWRDKFEDYVADHDRQRRNGLKKSFAFRARVTPEYQELQALNWLLLVPAFREDSIFQNFVSTLTEDTVPKLLLQTPDFPFNSPFSDRLRDLLWTCIPGSTGPTSDAQQHRLLTCLDAIYSGVRGYNVAPLDQSGGPIPYDIRFYFADLRIMRALWSEQSSATIRIRARCICALLARRVLRDIGGTGHPCNPEASDLYWLAAVFDGPSQIEIFNSLSPDLAEMDSMNLRSFVRRVESPFFERASVLTNKETTYILDTLAILMGVEHQAQNSLRKSSLQERIRALTQRAEASGPLQQVQQLVMPLLVRLGEEFPTGVGAAPADPMPSPMSMSMSEPHSHS